MRFGTFAALAALAASALLPAAAAQAQEANTQSAGTTSPEWVKVCTDDPRVKKSMCLVTYELRTGGGQVLASAAVRGFKGEQRRSLLIAVPTGMVIEPGVMVQVDGGEAEKAEYQVCLESACWAERALSPEFINEMKSGSTMRLTSYNREGKQVPFDLTLGGFTEAFDGEPLSPEQVQAVTQARQAQFEKSQQDFAERLRAAQRDAMSAASAQ